MLYSSERSIVGSGAVACVMALLFCSIDIREVTYFESCNNSDAYNIVNDICNCSIFENIQESDDLYDYLGDCVINVNNLYLHENEFVVEEDTEEQIEEEIREGEIELLAQLIEAEAGNQDYRGKCLVADVVLNRVESDRFPDSIEEVIFQSGQFACVDDGGFDKAGWSISEDSFKAAEHEYSAFEVDYDILFFTAGGYNKYCVPMYKYGDHYFGS